MPLLRSRPLWAQLGRIGSVDGPPTRSSAATGPADLSTTITEPQHEPNRGFETPQARQRRGELAAAFRRCLALANEHEVDLVTIGGDLWEEEHVTTDTRNSVVYELEQLHRQVLIICGNHDPLIPGGTYARVRWPDNVGLVHLSKERPRLVEATKPRHRPSPGSCGGSKSAPLVPPARPAT